MITLIDAAAVLNSLGFSFSEEGNFLTVPEVADEFRDVRSRHLVQNALENGLLKLEQPSDASISKIKALASEHGFSRLSNADVSLLALALDLKVKSKKFLLITDDYSVQNFAKLLGIEFDSVIHGKIEKTISFKKVCTDCGKKFSGTFAKKKCPDCGSQIKAKRSA